MSQIIQAASTSRLTGPEGQPGYAVADVADGDVH